MSPSELRHDGAGTRYAASLLLALVMLGIGRPAIAAEQIPPAAMSEAEQIYKSRCAMCHGAGGKGDGPAAAAFDPKPRDLCDPAWQRSVTDEHIERAILSGGPAVGKSPLMPSNPDLANKPDVLKALRLIVRNLASH